MNKFDPKLTYLQVFNRVKKEVNVWNSMAVSEYLLTLEPEDMVRAYYAVLTWFQRKKLTSVAVMFPYIVDDIKRHKTKQFCEFFKDDYYDFFKSRPYKRRKEIKND